MTELPLFPLSGVLLPYGKMPLQIFEQRYLDLVRDSMKNDSPFGVVWIRRGAEVAVRGAAAPQLGDYGTSARIVDWDRSSRMSTRLSLRSRSRIKSTFSAICLQLPKFHPNRAPRPPGPVTARHLHSPPQ